ncbi:MAG: transcription-repair coupling factor, partial [Atopostipes suicloacalis]|nr:transcription-repair coupling factor [Atopostipes suicloacalis]
MSKLLDLLLKKDSFKKVLNNLTNESAQLITGIADSARAVLMAAIWEEKKNPLVIFTSNLHKANQLYDDLSIFVKEEQLFIYNVNDLIHTQLSIASPEEQAERIEALEFLLSGDLGIILIPIAGTRRMLAPKELYKKSSINLNTNSEIDLAQLINNLVAIGYRREEIVGQPGEFSVRGGIIDIYPLTESHPIRVELFDIEVDSIRYFDASTQRSIKKVEAVKIAPVTEIILPMDSREDAKNRMQKAYEKTIKKEKDEGVKKVLADNVMPVIDALEDESLAEKTSFYRYFLYDKQTTIMDYLPENSLLLYDEYPKLIEKNHKLDEDEFAWIEGPTTQAQILKGQNFSVGFQMQEEKLKQARIYFSMFEKGMRGKALTAVHHFHYRQMQKFFSQMEIIQTELQAWQNRAFTQVIMTENIERSEQLKELLSKKDIEAKIISDSDPLEEGKTQIIAQTLRSGFELIEEKVVIITEKELFDRIPKKRRRQLNITNAEKIKDYNELDPGDYVVHVNHGIGKYIGLETIEIKGIHQDYLTIEYQKNDRVLIPVSQLDLIQKYVSAEGKSPRLHKLGGTTWAKTKNRVQKQVEDIADDLIELYAERESRKGFSFSKNDAYYREFEEAFPYTETRDQVRSIKEVNKSMEEVKPMDRLVVGDVGYGKTEVAMRAAFKAIQDGKQVAFLVPTTVLAQQHYESFIERFVDFPVEIEVLSRFRTKKQTKEILASLRKGQIDILIGTHRILSKDIVYQDLGLLVVDEEQRFGVKHKERIKQLKKDVDVLTLTATPIPRTLHMSLVGARDLSVIETPPANRYPVQTYVMPMSPLVIQEAIEREMARGGQVFFLHNRVDTIEKRVKDIQNIVPDARVTYIHGRLTENQLENVLYQFIQGEYDVLVTTTIIETGIDMPNVNTLLVENADHLGLSQLYQLRGRVGRSNRIAYAYFMHKANKMLTEESEKRLQAIKDFTELGSGFKIAMRDLAIRGAGNLLGQQQHGFIDSVGFDLYSQMLEEAVARKQGKDQGPKLSVEIDLDVNAYIPTIYVSDERQKIEFYKRIRRLASEEEYEELQDDFIDRFGDYPQEVDDLLVIALIKHYAQACQIKEIKQSKLKVSIYFTRSQTEALDIKEVFKALEGIPLKVDLDSDEELILDFHLKKNLKDYQWLAYFLRFLRKLCS